MFISKGSLRQIIGAVVVGFVFGASSAQAARRCLVQAVPAFAKLYGAKRKYTLVVTKDGARWVKSTDKRFKTLLARYKIVRFFDNKGKEVSGLKWKIQLKKALAKDIKVIKKEANADVKNLKKDVKAEKKDAKGAVQKRAIKKNSKNDIADIKDMYDVEIKDLEAENLSALVEDIQQELA